MLRIENLTGLGIQLRTMKAINPFGVLTFFRILRSEPAQECGGGGVLKTVMPRLLLSFIKNLYVCRLCAQGDYATSVPSLSFALVNLNML